MDARYGPVKLRVPKGFPVLLQRFAREVLREQPQDIATFGAEYFRNLLDYKQKTGEDPLKGDPYDDGLLFKASQEKVLRPISSETRQTEIKLEAAATKIQAEYRGYLVRRDTKKNIEKEQQNNREVAATKIQANYRGYAARKSKTNASQNISEERQKTEDVSEKEYHDDERNAAVLIQANYRGYKTRKSLKSTEKNELEEDEPIIDTDDPEMEAAALKIQASFRGHKARKELKKNDDDVDKSDQDHAEIILPVAEQNKEDEIENDDETELYVEEDEEEVVEEEQTEEDPDVEDEEEQVVDATMDPNREVAAVKIQASYRAHKTRQQLKKDANVKTIAKEDGVDLGGGDAFAIAEKNDDTTKPSYSSGPLDTPEVLEERREEEDASEETVEDVPLKENVNNDDDSDKEKAAIKIQSQYRGYKTRKNMKTKDKQDLV